MKESMWGYYLALLGITVSTVMILMSNMTTTNQQNYYLLKEVTHAAMNDAIDFAYYREYGSMKINREKFVENFLRRFSEGVSKSNTYKIDFYSINENPPSVSVKVTSNTGEFTILGDSNNVDIVNTIDAILESNNVISASDIFTDVPYGACTEWDYISKDTSSEDYGYCRVISKKKFNLANDSIIVEKIKNQLNVQGSSFQFKKENIKILDVEYLSPLGNERNCDTRYNCSRYAVGSYEKKRCEYNTQRCKNWDELFYNKGASKRVELSGEYDKLYLTTSSVADVSGIGAGESSNFFAENIRNVNLSIVRDPETSDLYFAYGLEFNCKSKDGNSDYVFETYRNKNYYFKSDNHSCPINPIDYENILGTLPEGTVRNVDGCGISKTEYETLKRNNPTEAAKYHIYFEHIKKANVDTDEERAYYERAPYEGNCIIGFEYKVDFYYDLS